MNNELCCQLCEEFKHIKGVLKLFLYFRSCLYLDSCSPEFQCPSLRLRADKNRKPAGASLTSNGCRNISLSHPQIPDNICTKYHNKDVVTFSLMYDLSSWITAQQGWWEKNLALQRQTPPTADLFFFSLQQSRKNQLLPGSFSDKQQLRMVPSSKQSSDL